MRCTIRTFGLWIITAPRGAEDPRVFLEDRNGDWRVSRFQRAVGIRLHPPSVYRRSFTRMGDWKGFFATHAARSHKRHLVPFIREACRNLDAPRATVQPVQNARALLQGATGHAILWSRHLRLRSVAPKAKLIARIHVKTRSRNEVW